MVIQSLQQPVSGMPERNSAGWQQYSRAASPVFSGEKNRDRYLKLYAREDSPKGWWSPRHWVNAAVSHLMGRLVGLLHEPMPLDSPYSSERAAHELGHLVTGMASGRQKPMIFMGKFYTLRSKGKVTGGAFFLENRNRELTPGTADEVRKMLLYIIGGYVFHANWLTAKPSGRRSAEIKRAALTMALADMNKIRTLLRYARDNKLLKGLERLDLSPIRYRQARHQSGLPDDQRQQVLATALVQAETTLNDPLVKKAVTCAQSIYNASRSGVEAMVREMVREQIFSSPDARRLFVMNTSLAQEQRMRQAAEQFTRGQQV